MIISFVLLGFNTISRSSLILLMVSISDCRRVLQFGRSFPLDSHLSMFVARHVERSIASCKVVSSINFAELRVAGSEEELGTRSGMESMWFQ